MEQEQAEERRKKEEARRKEQQEEQRARGTIECNHVSTRALTRLCSDRRAAEVRQRNKASMKKAQAEASRKSAENKAKTLLERSQALRSAVFAAARAGDAQKVKKGVYEDHVDAAGGETKRGCDAFVKAPPKDRSETLSHIAAERGDSTLFEWLDTHGEPHVRPYAKAYIDRILLQVLTWRNVMTQDSHRFTLRFVEATFSS